jgi:hypothetical protein
MNQKRHYEHIAIVYKATRAHSRIFVLLRAIFVELSSSPADNPNPPNPKSGQIRKGCHLEHFMACYTVSRLAKKDIANERDRQDGCHVEFSLSRPFDRV